MSQKLVMKLVYWKESWLDSQSLMLVIPMDSLLVNLRDYQLANLMELMLVIEYLPMAPWWVNLMDDSLDYLLVIL